jgi:hypothetical protein
MGEGADLHARAYIGEVAESTAGGDVGQKVERTGTEAKATAGGDLRE